MISIIITAREEPKATFECIRRILIQKIPEKYEVWVTCPDKPTKDVVIIYKKKYPEIIHFLQQPPIGKGKNSMLNLLFKKVKGKIIIMTDGDVFLENNSIREIYNFFKNPKIGAVCGRPMSLNSRKNMLGYWSHLLNYGAHKIRKKLFKEGKFLECSGYIWAIRKGIIKEMPLDVAEDSITPYFIWKKDYKIAYAEKARAYTQFPTNIKDWINQKVRTAKAHERLDFYMKNDKRAKVKSFSKELIYGWVWAFFFAKNPIEFFWTLLLFPFRLYVWIKYFYEIKILNRHFGELWTRVKSTRPLD
jgi:cellulose synthase/poly-beta-1,6-N-acetylglucosamine synthase-like glycosyltransferase